MKNPYKKSVSISGDLRQANILNYIELQKNSGGEGLIWVVLRLLLG